MDPANIQPDTTIHERQDLRTRLANYTLVNTVFQQYENLKSVSPLIKAGLETAENTTQTLVNLAQPVIQPVITKLDSALHLEDTANKVLDKTEELGTKVANAYHKGVEQSENIKDAITHTLAAGVGYTNKPINQLLDVTESVVNSILPPELELESIDIHEELPAEQAAVPSTTQSVAAVSVEATHLDANPFPRIKQLGGGVSKRVKRVAIAKLNSLSFRSPTQANSFGYVVDLIQYTAEYIDIDKKTQTLKDTTANIQQYFAEKKEQTAKFISPAREVIERHTADIKEQGTKTIVSIVSSITHTTEVVRRQFAGQVLDLSQLQANLAQITTRTKEAILNLPEPQLRAYVAYVRSMYTYALESLLNLTYAYTPVALSTHPLFASIDAQLQSWRYSLLSRLNLQPQLQQLQQPLPEPPKELVDQVLAQPSPQSPPRTPLSTAANPEKLVDSS